MAGEFYITADEDGSAYSSTKHQASHMDDNELLDIVSRLETACDYDAACSKLSGDGTELWLTGNRDGLLQFAAAFLEAAAAPIPDDETRSGPAFTEHEQIVEGETDYVLRGVQRIDSFPEAANATKKDRDGCALIACATIGFVILSLLLSGVVFCWHLITETPLGNR